MKEDYHEFAQKLIDYAWGEMFYYPSHEEIIDSIWDDSHEGDLLDKILWDKNIDKKARFITCEVFFRKDVFFMERHPAEEISGIYTNALINDYTGMANSWGLLYEEQDDGEVGIAFLTIGLESIPSLFSLLDNTDVSLMYHGSEEATIGNSRKYRIKDFAAYYLGGLLEIPLVFYTDCKKRDEQIDELKKEILNQYPELLKYSLK